MGKQEPPIPDEMKNFYGQIEFGYVDSLIEELDVSVQHDAMAWWFASNAQMKLLSPPDERADGWLYPGVFLLLRRAKA